MHSPSVGRVRVTIEPLDDPDGYMYSGEGILENLEISSDVIDITSLGDTQVRYMAGGRRINISMSFGALDYTEKTKAMKSNGCLNVPPTERLRRMIDG